MTQVKVILGNGSMIDVSSNTHDADGIKKVILSRQKIAYDYCNKKGWPTEPEKLSFEQILEIRKQQSWIDAGK
jgi:hypothetical protein